MHPIPCTESAVVLHLKRAPFFKHASEASLARMAQGAALLEYARGETVYGEDEPAEACYLVLSGRVKLVHLLNNGSERLVHVMGSMEHAGLTCMFRQTTYDCSAVAQESCRLVRLQRREFLDAVASCSALAQDLLGVFAIRIRMLTKKLGSQGSRLGSRLAAFILHRTRFAGCEEAIDLGMSREELANMMGTARETLSRNLSRLVAEGLVAVSGRKVTILDRKGLEAWAGDEPEAGASRS